MPAYTARVIIENKPGISDPEGATILSDLLLLKYSGVSQVRTAKMLSISLQAKTPADAKKKAAKMCDEMRIYNPIVSRVEIAVKRQASH